MDEKIAKKRIKELTQKTQYHAKQYYDNDQPEISDYEYDIMMVELRNLETMYPELKEKETLTSKVGGSVKEGFSKVEHRVPLQSLQDVFSLEEVEEFVEKIEEKAKVNGIKDNMYVVETKIDGLSAAIEYSKGQFKIGATRGNRFNWRGCK